MLKNINNFPNEYLDFDCIVVSNDSYFPVNSFGGSVLLDRGGSIYIWNSTLKKYELNIKSKHLTMISENVIALCEHGGHNIPNLKLEKQIAVNLTPSNLIIDDRLIWSIDEFTKIRVVVKPIFEHDGYLDIHHNGEFIRIMCKDWQLEHFKYVVQEINLVKKLCGDFFENEIL